MKWDVQQEAVIETARSGFGSIAAIARAGAGKTTVTRGWIDALPSSAERMRTTLASATLATSFSDHAVRTLAAKLTPGSATCATIHALAWSWVRYAWPYIKLDRTKRYKHTDAACIEARKFAYGRQTVDRQWSSRVAKLASFAKNTLAGSVEDLTDLARSLALDSVDPRNPISAQELAQIAARVLETTLSDLSACDFDDQLWLAVRYNLGPGRPYKYISVDEAQNTNRAQLWIIQRALAEDGRALITGDPMQALYSWRGADARAIDVLVDGLGAQKLPMSISHRCPRTHVALAKTIVPDFTAADDAEDGIQDRATWNQMIEGAAVGDFIVARFNVQAARAGLALIRRGIPVSISGKDYGQRIRALAERARVRSWDGLIGWLEGYLERETRGLIADNRQRQANDVEDLVRTTIKLVEETNDWDDFVRRVGELFADDANPADVVTCSTVHRAQSQERATVWAVDWTPRTDADPDEERRVRYVAWTRSSAVLHLVDDERAVRPRAATRPVDARPARNSSAQLTLIDSDYWELRGVEEKKR